MVTKKPKGLGRGLEALLGPKVAEAVEQSRGAEPGVPSTLRLDEMVPGMYQPRTRMDEGALYELAESIKAQGIMQPILVRRLAEGAHAGKYEIIAGERRFRAAKLAGLDSVPVLVRDVPDEAAAAMSLIENRSSCLPRSFAVTSSRTGPNTSLLPPSVPSAFPKSMRMLRFTALPFSTSSLIL